MTSRLASLALALSLLAGAASAATVSGNTAGFIPGMGPNESVRFRAQNTGSEIYVGAGDLGVGANRVEANVAYAASQAFSLFYNSAAGTLTATIGTVTATAGSSRGVTSGDLFNALRVDIRGPRTRTAPASNNYFTLTGLTVNGEAIPDLPGSSTTNTTVSFVVSRIANLGGNIQLSGTLNYFGSAGNASAEAAKVDVAFGVAPVPVPAALPLMLLALGGLGLAARRRRAG